MESNNMAKSDRSEKRGWSIISTGDNGFDLVQFVIDVENIKEASDTANKIASYIMQYERPDDIFNTQITIRDWRVEIQLVLPNGTWGTVPQQKITDLITQKYSVNE